MIYLCQPCKLASQACGGACTGMQKMCGESCSAIQGLCRGACNIFTFITHYPLGGYVMGTWATMILVIVASGLTVTKIGAGTDVVGSSTSTGTGTVAINSTTTIAPSAAPASTTEVSDVCMEAQMFCFVNIALGVAHFVMSRYVQWRIKQKINAEMGGTAENDVLENADIPHAQIAQAARHIFMYDIGFCLYFFVFFGSLGYNLYSIGTVGNCTPDADWGWTAATMMILYGFGCSFYFFCWYCMQACCGAAKKGATKGQAVAAQAVGAPSTA